MEKLLILLKGLHSCFDSFDDEISNLTSEFAIWIRLNRKTSPRISMTNTIEIVQAISG